MTLFVAQEMAPALGFAPSLQLNGPLDTQVSEDVAENMLTALRESLANAARHSEASQVDVTVTVNDELVLTVRDNGTGFTPGGRRSGLRNLEERALGLGGSLTVGPSIDGQGAADHAGRGTEIIWRVPLGKPG